MSTDNIAAIFSREGYVWTFKDGKRIPNADEIQHTIDASIAQLRTEQDGTQIEVGRLIVRKAGSFYDVYLHVQENL